MQVQNLRNYGCSLVDTGDIIPPELFKEIRKRSMSTMRRHLGLIGMVRFVLALRGERKRLLQHDYAAACKYGLTHIGFIESRVQNAAMFSALSKVIGEDRALAIQMEVTENLAHDMMSIIFPSTQDLEACGDPFEAFKAYMRAGNEANVAAGVHRIEEIEDTPNVYRFNTTYCAYQAIPAEVGLGKACLPSCYGDEVFFPRACGEFGVRFVRQGTLARGNKVCDFCFERIRPEYN